MVDPFDLSEAPLGEPASLVIGQSAQWRREIDIDQALFTVSYTLRGADPSKLIISVPQSFDMAPVSSGVWGADIVPTDTAGWVNGRFFWDMVVTRVSDGRTKVIDSGLFDVYVTDDDRRSHARIMVAKIESIIENRADSDVSQYTIKNRSITKMSISELREWRDYYLDELASETIVGGIFDAQPPNKTTLRIRFRN